MTPFGLFLQDIRRDRRLAQKQLAGLLEVDQSYLSGLESGRKGVPPASMVGRLMVRFLSSNDVNKASFVVISTLDVDQVGDEWKPSVRELAASLRATNLKKNRKLKEDQGRTTLRVDYAKTESDAIKLLLSHLSMVNAAMVALLSKEPR